MGLLDSGICNVAFSATMDEHGLNVNLGDMRPFDKLTKSKVEQIHSFAWKWLRFFPVGPKNSIWLKVCPLTFIP
jgi:hypothetical protein